MASSEPSAMRWSACMSFSSLVAPRDVPGEEIRRDFWIEASLSFLETVLGVFRRFFLKSEQNIKTHRLSAPPFVGIRPILFRFQNKTENFRRDDLPTAAARRSG